jgi:hypothetical protein
MPSTDATETGVNAGRMRWRFVWTRRSSESRDDEGPGWSHILLGTDSASNEDRVEVRERAIRTWMEDHGIADCDTDAPHSGAGSLSNV